MNELMANIIGWLLFALASTCILSFASNIYDNFINRKQQGRDRKALSRIAPLSGPKPSQPVTEKPLIRGYDTPELFREDLWIRRIEQSRQEHAALVASIPQGRLRLGALEDYPRRLCEMLAQHSGTRPR
jgi:hypothetical protein